jgi:acetamidase/formamidase
VQQSLRDIVTQVTDKGPGGHILTGPIYVEGADSGDVLEVRILRIDLALPYDDGAPFRFRPLSRVTDGFFVKLSYLFRT